MPQVPQAQFRTPDAWRGSELARSDAWRVRLTDSEIAELCAARAAAAATGKPMAQWHAEDFPLPTLAPRIAAWMRELNHGRGFVLLKGFPVLEHSKEQCAEIYWGLGLQMGTPVPQNSEGDLLGHVRDTGVAPAPGVRLYKTRAEQEFHTDGADIVGLFCLRSGKSGGVSRIASSVAIFDEIFATRPELVPALFEKFPHDEHGQQRAGAQPWFEIPICHAAAGRLRVFFLPWYIRNSQRFAAAPRLSAAQQAGVEAIERLANDPRFSLDMHFEPGDIQWLKNASILHKRSEYEDWDEPDRKRHLLRLWLTSLDFSAGHEELRNGIAGGGTQVRATPELRASK